jgi:hypothetical protein
MNQNKIFAWEITGFVVISFSGSLLHFAFEFFGEWPPMALLAAVNESVWEHLKLAFWPALVFALIEWPFFRRKVENFWTAKAAGIFVMPLSIVLLFYGYTALAGGNVLWADISLFILAVLIGQMLSGWIMARRPRQSRFKTAAAILLALMIIAFSLLTFFPPKCPLFRDSRTGQYGILK